MAKQDRNSGAAADRFGRDNAKRIAKAIGAQMIRAGSNESVWNGQRVVIKSAQLANTTVGVSYKMLEHLDGVLGAFENADGSYRLILLTAKSYTTRMQPTRSTGPSAKRVGVVNRTVFDQQGRFMGIVRV